MPFYNTTLALCELYSVRSRKDVKIPGDSHSRSANLRKPSRSLRQKVDIFIFISNSIIALAFVDMFLTSVMNNSMWMPSWMKLKLTKASVLKVVIGSTDCNLHKSFLSRTWIVCIALYDRHACHPRLFTITRGIADDLFCCCLLRIKTRAYKQQKRKNRHKLKSLKEFFFV